jgi:hypothetical protein
MRDLASFKKAADFADFIEKFNCSLTEQIKWAAQDTGM